MIASETGAGWPVEIKGKTYRVSPLTIGDLGEFEQWIKVQKMLVLKQVGFDSLDEKIAMQTKILNDPITDEEYESANKSQGGIAFLLWRCLRKHHPEITLEGAGQLIDKNDMWIILNAIQQVGKVDTNHPTPEEGNQQQPEQSPSPNGAAG